MSTTVNVYGSSLALLTDLYQLTMAYGYWKLGRADERAVFQLYLRKNPFGGGYTVAAGLEYVVAPERLRTVWVNISRISTTFLYPTRVASRGTAKGRIPIGPATTYIAAISQARGAKPARLTPNCRRLLVNTELIGRDWRTATAAAASTLSTTKYMTPAAVTANRD